MNGAIMRAPQHLSIPNQNCAHRDLTFTGPALCLP
jgi:hypothetical protein